MTINLQRNHYNRMAILANSVLLDYGFYTFPIDVHKLALKIGMHLIPYSSLSPRKNECLLQKVGTEKGLTVFRRRSNRTIYDTYYNDDFNEAACRFTIAHEIKHVVAEDVLKKDTDLSEQDELLADYFAKCLLAPQAIIIQSRLNEPEEYVKKFGLSRQAASIWFDAVEKRKNKYGDRYLFDYEIDFLDELARRQNMNLNA